MPRKSKSSKSSKKKKTSKSHKSSSKNANVPERNVEKQLSDEGATFSFQTENYVPKKSDESTSEIYVYIEESLSDYKERSPSAFEKSESVESSKWVESSKSELSISVSLEFSVSPTRSKSVQSFIYSPMRSESVLSPTLKYTYSPVRSESVETPAAELLETSVISDSVESLGSFSSESIKLAVRSESVESLGLVRSGSVELRRTKSADPPAKSESAKSSLRRILSEPILKSKLTDWGKELFFTELMRDRKPYFIHLYESGSIIVNFMKYLINLRNKKDREERFPNNRWKQNDASDWFDLLKLLGETLFEIEAFMCVLKGVYEIFSEHADISTTITEFYCFIEDLKDVSKLINQLLKRCTNSYYKYSRFCATNNESLFLQTLSKYRKQITCFQKKIQIELNKFTALGVLALDG